MPSTTDQRQIDAPDLVPHADQQHGNNSGQNDREDLARAFNRFSERYLADDPQIKTSPPAAMNNVYGGRLSGTPMLRCIIGLALAACIFIAAVTWQSSTYGDAAKLIVAPWAAKLVPPSSLTAQNLVVAPQPSTSQVATPETALPEPVPARQEASPAEGTQSPDELQLLQRTLANAEQEIEQLKASQRQMAQDNAQLKAIQEQTVRDNANLAEQIKENREQIARLATSGQNLQPKTSAPSSGRTKAR